MEVDEEEEEDPQAPDNPAEKAMAQMLSLAQRAAPGRAGRFQMLSPLLYPSCAAGQPQDTGNYSCRVEEWLPSPQKNGTG